jgi:biopolymer transport protein TolR
MSRRRRTYDDGVMPEMNVTPLVDVVLVLLIIFMVVAPQLEQDVPVNLPGIFNPDPEVDVSADPPKAGEFHIDGTPHDLEQAVERLQVLHAAEPSRRLVIRADAKLPYNAIRDLMSRAQLLGFPGLNLMVGEKHRDAAPPTAPPADALPADVPSASPPATTEGAG